MNAITIKITNEVAPYPTGTKQTNKTTIVKDKDLTPISTALVIYEGDKDVVTAFISSKVPSKLSGVDILITKNHPGFGKTGLKTDSVIKLDKIATVLKELIVGELGELNEERKTL